MLERIFRWTCDACCKQAEVPHYGGPEGWMWMYGQESIHNYCPDCCASMIAAETHARNDKDDSKQLLPLPPKQPCNS